MLQVLFLIVNNQALSWQYLLTFFQPIFNIVLSTSYFSSKRQTIYYSLKKCQDFFDKIPASVKFQ